MRSTRGIPVATHNQCIRDLARVLPLVDLVVLLDSVCARDRIDVEDLAAGLGVRVAPRLRRALALASPRSESPTESRLRLLIVLAGLAPPTPQHVVTDPLTGQRYRLDLAFPDLRVAVEYDGRHHASDSRQYAGDVERRNALQRMGWTVITVVAQGLFNNPGQILEEIAEAIGSRTARRPMIDQRWRGHFAQWSA